MLLVVCVGGSGCTTSPDPDDVVPQIDGGVVDSFPDHTRHDLASIADFEALSEQGASLPSVKAIVTSFGDAESRDVRFLDGHFYTLHDEWYWFRLLNGARVPGDPTRPVMLRDFQTLPEIYDWAHLQSRLPLDLVFTDDDRLYSARFYTRSFGDLRSFGLATLLRIPARTKPTPAPERWAFEIEYRDAATYEQLVTFFETLTARVPSEIGSQLHFLVRSAEQETLVRRMETEHLPYWDRVLRYTDLVVPGAREVYSDGIAAGRLRLIRRGESFDRTASTDILVFEDIPDRLPPGAGVLTSVPQTPLAHINILARNRGIPNAYLAGVLEDEEIKQLARGYAPVVFRATSPDHVVVRAITEIEYARYRSLVSQPDIVVTPPPIDTMPYFIDLESRSPDEIEELGTTIGGKCVGMLALAHVSGLERPDHPQSLTVRAYVEHLAPMRARIEAALADATFKADARARYLVLEGEMAYRAAHRVADDLVFADTFLAAHPAGNSVGDLARSGGVRGLVTSTPIAAETLATILASLRERFADLAYTQGIRFRSSSNVEDIEGFNGAGLYESQTGFIDAERQPRMGDRTKTVERAIKLVWASYWAFEAFEERRLERVDSMSGAMALMVHPRFDDPLERATGVFTFSIMPLSSADDRVLDVNVQKGEESVANPNPTVLPEVVRLRRARGASELRIERVRRSTLSPAADLLGDAALREMFADADRATQAWLDRQNASRTAAQRGRSLTLDFEFHDMLAGWPAMVSQETRPARLVFKQARTLEPGPRTRSADIAALPVPREILVRARRIDERRCTVAPASEGEGAVTVSVLRVLTDASLSPDVGHASSPFYAALVAEAQAGAVSALEWASGTRYVLTHLQYSATTESAVTTLQLHDDDPSRPGIELVQLGAEGKLTVHANGHTLEGSATCVDSTRFSTARDYLLELLGES